MPVQFPPKGSLLLSCALSTTLFCANPSMAASQLHENASTPRAAVQYFISNVERDDFARAADFAIYQQFKTRQQVLSFLKGFAGPDRVLQYRVIRVEPSPAKPFLNRTFVTIFLKQRFGKRVFAGNQVVETIKRQDRWFVYVPTPNLARQLAHKG